MSVTAALVKELRNRYGLAVMSNEQINIGIGGVYGSDKGNAELSGTDFHSPSSPAALS